MQPTQEMISLAAERLNADPDTIRSAWLQAPGLEDACIFSDGTGRGARRLLMTRELETLGSTSGISADQIVADFRSGLRS